MSLILTRSGRSLTVKNLCPGLVERGKIKIGMKGEWRKTNSGAEFQLPVKLDHFIITGMSRDNDGNFAKDDKMHELLGAEPHEIPVRLLYDDIALNFQSRYACYAGRTLWCTGDGESAGRMKSQNEVELVPCPCERQNPGYQGKDKCKINGTLSVIIDRAEIVGGVWKFRTTSYNSVVGIMSSLALIKSITGGPLAGIPLMMIVQPKAVANPVDGKMQTVYVVSLEFRGTMASLKQTGYQIALEYKKHDIKIESVEAEARKLLSADTPFNEHSGEVVEEFYPDAAASAGPPPAEDPAPAAQAPIPATQAPAPAAGTQAPPQAGTQAPAQESGTGSAGSIRRGGRRKKEADPNTLNPAPATQAPAPATQAPAPATQAPAPAAQAPTPATQAPTPAAQAPTPATQAPAPAKDNLKLF